MAKKKGKKAKGGTDLSECEGVVLHLLKSGSTHKKDVLTSLTVFSAEDVDKALESLIERDLVIHHSDRYWATEKAHELPL